MASELLVCHLGRVEYREATALQERLRQQVIAGELPELMLLLGHPPAYPVTPPPPPAHPPHPPDRIARPAVPRALLQRARDRRRPHAAWRPAHLPRAGPA